MRFSLLRPLALFLLLAGTGTGVLQAAAPTVTLIKAPQVKRGESIALHAEVADADGNLQVVSVFAAGAGITAEQLLSTKYVSGATASIDYTWTPPQVGVYTIRVSVGDLLAESATASLTTQAFLERSEVSALNLNSGAVNVVSAAGEIRTKANNAATEVAANSGADLVFWAQSQVVLKPGFRAKSGAKFWAAVDSDMDGYSDMEEVTDLDGDGQFDAWERDHGKRPNYAWGGAAGTAAGAGPAGGYTNGNLGGTVLPSGYQLVLRLPGNSYAGVQTDNDWHITTLSISP